jgi:hypothetical protein
MLPQTTARAWSGPERCHLTVDRVPRRGRTPEDAIVISTTSIRRLLSVRSGPGPHWDSWRQFMRTVESIRLKTLHGLVFIELHTRWVLIGGVAYGPANLTWCTQVARNLSEAREERSKPIRFLVHGSALETSSNSAGRGTSANR